MAKQFPKIHYIGEWLEFREFTQEHLAELVKMSKQSVGRIANFKRPLQHDKIERFAKALTGGDVAALFMPPPSSADLRGELSITCHKLHQLGLTETLLSVARGLLEAPSHRKAA